MTTSARKHFFVSYQASDASWAEWIAATLVEAGYSVVIQAWDFRPGQNFILEMQRAASQAERTIAVLSPHFLNSRFAAVEWAAAFAQDPTGEQRKLIPVRVASCRMEGLLGPIVYIDLVGKDVATARAALISGLRESGRANQLPRFPGEAAESERAAFTSTAPAYEPQPAPSASRTAELRRLLDKSLRTDADFMAFCLDYFPSVHRRFAAGMDRMQKENLLLDLIDPDELADRIKAEKP